MLWRYGYAISESNPVTVQTPVNKSKFYISIYLAGLCRMTTTFFLAPNARWQGRDLTGQPCIFGKLYTYESGTNVPKPTYQDKDGQIPNEQPVPLDGKGEANIYWLSDDTLYTIRLETADGDTVYTQDDYPWVATNQDTPVDESILVHNIIRNPQFTQWSNSTSFPDIKANANYWDYCVDDWLYSKTTANSEVKIERMAFDLGQAEVPGSPIYFTRYICSNIGSGGETNSHLYQRFDSVQTFANKTVTPSIALKCLGVSSATVEIYLIQNFGSVGSPSADVPTLAITATLSTSWQTFNPEQLITLPNINGKTLGSNGDDALIYSIKFPSNQTVTIDIANAQLVEGSAQLPFDYISQNDQFKRLDRTITQGVFVTSDVKPTILSTATAGWLLCNDTTIGDTLSGANTAALYTKALFKTLWAGVLNAYAPIYNSDGSVGTRTDAEGDYNLHKRLALTRTLGRVIASAGQAHLAETFTCDIANPGTLTLADTSSFYYGVPVTLTTNGTLPAGLSLATTYYVWNVSSTTIHLALTPQDAIDGVGIPTTTTGTGTHTITINYTNWAPGQFIGEEQHGLIESEMPSHSHQSTPNSSFRCAPDGAGGNAGNGGSAETSFAGGSTPHNNMQPTLFLNYMIKL